MNRILRSGKTILIDITATWCPPCKMLNRAFGTISGVLGDKVEIVTISNDTNPDTEKLYERLGGRPKGTPTVLIHQAGRTDVNFFQSALRPGKRNTGFIKCRGVKIGEQHLEEYLNGSEFDMLG